MAVSFSVGICAHNEVANIEKIIRSVLDQRLSADQKLKEIIVVSSASTDGTNEIVRHLIEKDKRIKLITERKRRGKSRAVNKFIKQASTKYLVLSSADLVLDKFCLDILIRELRKKYVGMTAPRVIPINRSDNIPGYAVHLQYRLFHRINLQFPERPRVGELIAFKKIFDRIPPASAVDEANIEPLIYLQDYKIKYCPEAIVNNKGSENIRDLLSQRRRIYAGHTELTKKYGYHVVTYSNSRVVGALLANFDWDVRNWPLLFSVVCLEAVARLAGLVDYHFRFRNHTVWKIAKSSKDLRLTINN